LTPSMLEELRASSIQELPSWGTAGSLGESLLHW
jgi:hypothetical protein